MAKGQKGDVDRYLIVRRNRRGSPAAFVSVVFLVWGGGVAIGGEPAYNAV